MQTRKLVLNIILYILCINDPFLFYLLNTFFFRTHNQGVNFRNIILVLVQLRLHEISIKFGEKVYVAKCTVQHQFQKIHRVEASIKDKKVKVSLLLKIENWEHCWRQIIGTLFECFSSELDENMGSIFEKFKTMEKSKKLDNGNQKIE